MPVFAGRQVKIKIDTNGVGGSGASWVALGQQRGGGFGRTTETADATHKDDNGWPAAVITRTPWSISCDGAVNPADSAWTYLKTQWGNKNKVWVQVDASPIGGEKVEGQCIITDLSQEFPESDVVTFNAEFEGASALVNSP